MAITFLQAKKRQRYLIVILGLLVFVSLIIVWQGLARRGGETPAPLSITPEPKEIIINWSVLQDPHLEGLQIFETIAPFEGAVGRKNPFIPY
ncbi:MAG: hypothetical protein A2896_01270 [Candidatus Nealsonbacteria bacterium RIFCSPLOWO2_01_FULL_43_32]|uniref:Uncharacterized protein n=1 Tax=Candidatus Nealsonbacteria bacterium RIFCSPLOWO2_01_FULL_43_32 TaxID=1801672 RepID=A0A1G2EF45_9BACT|nr:MAG: hypothetical protein A2896_01270 [Candidatus Nealsonbacteria bacterium RIFCSPLOWO2_01_FULL_43_32]